MAAKPSRVKSWTVERVAVLEPLIWRAYEIYGTMDFGGKYPAPKPFPAKASEQAALRSATRRYLVEETSIILIGEDAAGRWTNIDRADAIEIMERVLALAQDGYESGITAPELAAEIPGISPRLCDAYLGYLGATRH